MKPLVSVIIPTYNSAKYLKDALYSIVNQTYRNLEIFVIDDTTVDDGTETIIESFHDERIKYVRPKERLGLVKSLNYGIELSKGKYIARMDADDISHEKRIEIEVEFLQNHPEVGVVGASAYTINEKNKVTGIRRFSTENYDIKKKLLFNCSFIHPVVLMRADLLRENLYDETCFCCEDYELWSRMMSKTEFYNLPTILLKYRVFGNSANETQLNKMKSDNAYYERHLSVLNKIYTNVYKALGIPTNQYKEYDPNLVFAKAVSDYSLKTRYTFLMNYSKNMRQVDGRINYSILGYQWLKMSKLSFWRTSDVRLVALSIVQIMISGTEKISGIIKGMLYANRNLINWKL